MSDLELEVADSFDRVFPVPTVVADWDDVRFEPFHVARTLAPGELWSFLEVAYYPIGLLDADAKAALRGWVARTLVEPVDWRFGLARVHARRR